MSYVLIALKLNIFQTLVLAYFHVFHFKIWKVEFQDLMAAMLLLDLYFVSCKPAVNWGIVANLFLYLPILHVSLLMLMIELYTVTIRLHCNVCFVLLALVGLQW